MKIDLVSLSQEMNLESGVVIDYFVLRLPSGHFVRAVVDEESARMVHKITLGAEVDTSAESSVEEGIEISRSEAMALAETQAIRKFNPPSRKISVDDKGNPILFVEGGVDPGEVMASSDSRDEDGIGQI